VSGAVCLGGTPAPYCRYDDSANTTADIDAGDTPSLRDRLRSWHRSRETAVCASLDDHKHRTNRILNAFGCLPVADIVKRRTCKFLQKFDVAANVICQACTRR